MKKITFFVTALFIVSGCQDSTREQTQQKETVETSATVYIPDVALGELFAQVQKARIFPDGKTFVDCVPKIAPKEILAKYTADSQKKDFDLKKFITEYFEMPPVFASGFQSDTTQSVDTHINRLWAVLTRQSDTTQTDVSSSLLPLPKPYIVPGGRFREIYYWDSYFTMLGLQTARKTDSIESMIANFAFLLDKQGFIPNGNRTYYLSRSQPPFFALMVQLLADSKGEQILVKYLPQLEKEYNFWMAGKPKAKGTAQKRVVLLADGSLLNRYWDDRNAPRAESYAEDMHTAKQVPENKNIYHDLRAGAESGWDFSSRWFRDVNSLATIHTTEIIPVDLNALLYNLERTIAQAYQIQKNAPSTQKYLEKAEARKKALLQYCWNEKNGFFQDYDFVLQKHTPVLSLAGVYPLCFQIATSVQSKQVAAVLKAQFLKAGGLISTPNHTKQQWDAPNGWAPLQWMAIWGLRNYQQTDLADEIRLRWVSLNEKVFKKTGKLLEKYNVEDLSLIAGGGEYPLQDGFGWTNGVLLKLLSNK